MTLSQAFVLACVAGGSMIVGWEGNDLVRGEQRAEVVERHIINIESDAADWASEMARYEREMERTRRAMCSSFFIRTNLEFYERTDPKFPVLCGGRNP